MAELPPDRVAAWIAYNDAPWGRLRLDLIWALLERHLRLPPARVLDVGCGLAETATRLARAGSDVVAADASEAMLAEAKARSADVDVTWVVAELEHAGRVFAGERFDLVLCRNVLGYVPDPPAACAALASLLAPDGCLSITVGNRLAEPLRAALIRGDLAAALTAVESDARSRVGETLGAEFGLSDLDETRGWLETVELHVEAAAGIRVANDYLPEELKEGAGAYEAILRLELALRELDPYRQIAPFLHLLGRRRQERG